MASYHDVVTITTGWVALGTARLAHVTIGAPATNSASVEIRRASETTNAGVLRPGQWEEFRGIDLSDIEVRGTALDVLDIHGSD